MTNSKSKILNIIFYILVVLVFILGIYARFRFYMSQVPLWVDEVMLASSFTDRTLYDLFQPLEAYQKAPPLFCFLVLIIRKLFGINELSLRFIPFVFGILSMFAFYFLLKENVKSKMGIITGLSLFTFCVPLIYFCGEFKPYGCDVFFTILLLLLYKNINLNNLTFKRVFLYSLCSIMFIFLSFPTIFIIPAIVLTKSIEYKNFDYKNLFIFGAVLLSGLFLFLYDFNTYQFLQGYWGNVEKGFTLFPSLNFIWQFVYDGCKYYIYNFDSRYTPSILLFVLVGFGVLFKGKKEKSILISFIILFALISSLLSAYPLKPKLALYMLPIFILLIAKLFDILGVLKNNYSKIFFNIILATTLIFLVGVNVPYMNMDGNNLAYYNKASHGRNKSVEDRNKVKEYSYNIIQNINDTEKVLASAEFLYSLNYYKYYFKSSKNLNVNFYADIADRLSKQDLNKMVNNFINSNMYSGMWFVGRNNEGYFQCPNIEIIRKALDNRKLKYEYFIASDIYLIHVPK